jgi:hypothetical protein
MAFDAAVLRLRDARRLYVVLVLALCDELHPWTLNTVHVQYPHHHHARGQVDADEKVVFSTYRTSTTPLARAAFSSGV